MSQGNIVLRQRVVEGKRYYYTYEQRRFVSLGTNRNVALQRLRTQAQQALLDQVRGVANALLGRPCAADLLRKIESELAGEVIVQETSPLNRAKPRWFTAMFSRLKGLRNGIEEDELKRILVILRLLPDRLPTRQAIATLKPELRPLADRLRIVVALNLIDRHAHLSSNAQRYLGGTKGDSLLFRSLEGVNGYEASLLEQAMTVHLAWQLAPELSQVRDLCRHIPAHGPLLKALATYDRRVLFGECPFILPGTVKEFIAYLRALRKEPVACSQGHSAFALVCLPDMTARISAVLSMLDTWRGLSAHLVVPAAAHLTREESLPDGDSAHAPPQSAAAPACPTLAQALDRFMESRGKTLALKARDGYEQAFNRLLKEFKKDEPVSAITTDRLLKLRNTLCQDEVKRGGQSHVGVASRTLRRTADEMARMFGHCAALESHPALTAAVECIGKIDWVNPGRPPVRGKPAENGLTKDQIHKLFAAVRQDSKTGERNCALLAFMAYQGVRLNEAAVLTWKDVDLREDFVLIHGKGKLGKRVEEQRVLPPESKAALTAWKKLNPTAKPDDPVFGLTKHGIISLFRRLDKKYGASLGVHLHPHLMRVTCVTLLKEQGVATVTIQKVTGHESDAMVNHYTRFDLTEARDSLYRKRAGPTAAGESAQP